MHTSFFIYSTFSLTRIAFCTLLLLSIYGFCCGDGTSDALAGTAPHPISVCCASLLVICVYFYNLYPWCSSSYFFQIRAGTMLLQLLFFTFCFCTLSLVSHWNTEIHHAPMCCWYMSIYPLMFVQAMLFGL